ncbi:MAG: transposase [Christensenellales bacterium]
MLVNCHSYNLVHSLPGIQDILTCKFIAELGDISRFTNYKQNCCLRRELIL